MQKYEKDEINFHSFLNTVRKLTDVNLEQACEGLCSVSMMKRIEKGERLPQKQIRDRILARMGISIEGYEDYLSTEEYEQWSFRQRIIGSIEMKNINVARQHLEYYRGYGEKNAVKAQFCEAMELMLLQLENAPVAEQATVVRRAIELTMPHMEKELSKSKLLSAQELNLLIENVRLSEYQGGPEKEFEWRCRQYKDILYYIEHSRLDKSCRAMVYPKAVHYLCELILQKSRTEENIKLGITVCHQAIEVLRDSAKLYYFVEMVEDLELLADNLDFFLKEDGRKDEAELLRNYLEEKINMRDVIIELYRTHDVATHMRDFCYLYWEEESYCIGDVIRIRRRMFGMTKEQLCEGICSVKTLTRIEHKKAKTQMPIVRALFERLGLCTEYIRARVITSDYEVLKLAEQCARYENNYKIEKWEPCLDKLEQKLCMDIPQNKQTVMHSRYFLKYMRREFERDELREKLIEIIGYTIPLEYVMKPGEKFLSREERTYIRNIGVFTELTKDNPYMRVIQEICEQDEINNDVRVHIGKYEFLMSGVIEYLGEIGEYDRSSELGTRLITKSLVHRRTGIVARTLYNNLWNEQQKSEHPFMRDAYLEKVLKDCISLSEFHKREREIQFFEQKYRKCMEVVDN